MNSKKRTKFNLVFIFALAFPLRLTATEFSYRLRNAGSMWPGECNAKAVELGISFEEFTSKKVLTSRCESEQFLNETDVVIRYEADKPLNIVTTDVFFPASLPKGSYATKTKCEAGMAHHVALFERETGLKPFIFYCRKERHTQHFPWLVHIDSFGEPKKKPLVGFSRFEVIPKEISVSQLRAQFEEVFREEGATLDWFVFHPSAPYDPLVFLYYAQDTIRFDTHRVAQGLPLNTCMREKMILESAYSMAGGTAISIFCGGYPQANSSTQLLIIYLDKNAPRFSTAEETFKNYEDCSIQRPSLESKYRDKYKWPITGGICGYNERQILKLKFIETR